MTRITDLLENVKITRVANAAVAGTSDVNGTPISMNGFESVCFICLLGDVTGTSVLTLEAQAGADAGGSDAALISGSRTTSLTAGASNADNGMLAVEVLGHIFGANNYVRPVLKRGTANAVVDGIIAIQTGARKGPVTQDSSLLASIQSVG